MTANLHAAIAELLYRESRSLWGGSDWSNETSTKILDLIVDFDPGLPPPAHTLPIMPMPESGGLTIWAPGSGWYCVANEWEPCVPPACPPLVGHQLRVDNITNLPVADLCWDDDLDGDCPACVVHGHSEMAGARFARCPKLWPR